MGGGDGHVNAGVHVLYPLVSICFIDSDIYSVCKHTVLQDAWALLRPGRATATLTVAVARTVRAARKRIVNCFVFVGYS